MNNIKAIFIGRSTVDHTYILGGYSKLISCFGKSRLAAEAGESIFGNYSVEIHDMARGTDYAFPASTILINSKTGSRTIINSPETKDSLKLDYSIIQLTESSVIMLDGYNLHRSLRDKIIEARAKGIKIVMDGGSWKSDSGRTN